MFFHRSLLLFFCFFCLALPGTAFARTDAGPPREITLDEALTLSFQNRVELRAVRAEMEAVRGKYIQAAMPPNPEIGLHVENMGGSLPDEDVLEATLSLQQLIETGGKRSARIKKAEAEALLLRGELLTAWVSVAAEVRLAYLEVLAGRERIELSREAERISLELANVIRERVDAGELAAIEQNRAAARLALVRAEAVKARKELAGLEYDLAVALAEPAGITAAPGERLSAEVSMPELDSLVGDLHSSATIDRFFREKDLRAAELAVERTAAIPDPTLFFEVKEIPDKNGRAIAAGFSIPLPLFQKNQGGVADAEAKAKKAGHILAAEERRLKTELAKSHGALMSAEQESRLVRDEVIARAEESLRAVMEGFQQGKFRYTDVLEASQTLVEGRLRRLETITDLHRATITLDRLAGKPLPPNMRWERSTP